jgi:hypothetical protein
VLFRSGEDFDTWLELNPTLKAQTGAERKDAWIAAFPQLTAGNNAAFAEMTDDPTWDAHRVFPLVGLFAAPWFRAQAADFAARLGELQRRWEADE